MPNENVKNKFHSDLKCCYYAKAAYNEETGEITYETPVRIKNSVAVSLAKKGELIKMKADGVEVVFGSDNQGYDGDLEAIRFPESFETDCLGSVKNTDGTIDEFDNGNASPFALLFEFKGDVKGIRHCLYWCHATNPNIEGDNSDNITPKTEKITITSRPRPTDGKIKTKTGDTTTTEVYNAWYNSVHEQQATENSNEQQAEE